MMQYLTQGFFANLIANGFIARAISSRIKSRKRPHCSAEPL